MSPGCVEHSSLTVSPDPCPGFLSISFGTRFQDGSILFVMLRMDIRFVVALETFEALHHRMIWCRDDGAKGSCSVLQELGSDQCHDFVIVAEAVAGAMQRDKTFATRHISE